MKLKKKILFNTYVDAVKTRNNASKTLSIFYCVFVQF